MVDESTDIAVVVKSVEKFAEDVIKKLTLDITANLVEDTPVDVGWARANWIPSIGQPSTFDGGLNNSSIVYNRQERSEKVPMAAAAQADGLASTTQYQLQLGEIYITNNVPYIVKLNEGSSTQAPAAYVQRSIERGLTQNASIRQ